MLRESPYLSDEELARQCRAGSMDAFEQLVYRYEHRILGFVSQFCRNPTDAREITQDTFVKAFQGIAGFDPKRNFAAWLFTIARRKCIDHHRSASAKPGGDEQSTEQADEESPSELVSRREDGANLWDFARRRLGLLHYQALWLHYAEDMEVEQIARVLGKNRIHIRVMLFRARQILGRELNAASREDDVSSMVPTSKPRTLLTHAK